LHNTYLYLMSYKIIIDDRAYTSWSIVVQDTFEPASLLISPIEQKLFTDDVFTFNLETCDPITKTSAIITHSTVRQMTNIPAVLLIADGKTFGRKKDKLYYKCIPDDKRLPIFLVAYEIKRVGFFKTLENLFVTIQFESWDNTHPIGTLTQTIGPVDILDNFYEYQLFCKSLNHSIQNFNKHAIASVKPLGTNMDSLIHSICAENPTTITDRTDRFVFTIDPPSCGDYDDAFSITHETINGKEKMVVSIYISNVPIILNALNLWSSFSKRISTIYLPDRKRPMLPTVLSEQLCSLQQQCHRIAFTMELTISKDGDIEDIQFFNSKIFVSKNYAYESAELFANKNYNLLLTCSKQIAQKYKYINSINDSHELVAYLMILMNFHSAKNLATFGSGIFRATSITSLRKVEQNPLLKKVEQKCDQHGKENAEQACEQNEDKYLDNPLPNSVHNFIKIWRSSCGQYVDISKIESLSSLAHSTLELEAYTHITSPIRRIVDLLNMIQFQKNHNMFTFNPTAHDFYANWLQQIDYINVTMRAIRKVQTDCDLLSLCAHNDEILANPHDGYCFDKMARDNGLFQYNVYLPGIKLATRITTSHDMENYQKMQYKLFLFNNADNFKKKIRLQIHFS